MIKRIRFATRPAGVPPTEFAAAWPAAVAAAASAPLPARPLRVTASIVLPALTDPAQPHDGIITEWFTDTAHLELFGEWSASPAAAPHLEQLAHLTGSHAATPTSSPCDNSKRLVAEEVVLRGVDWLGLRWLAGGEKFKHLAVARRAAGLSAVEFSRRWRDHAGRAGAAVIPERARGLAYVQNHPLGEWPYDALTEVWFDDERALRTRIDWFAANVPNPADGGLFGWSMFIAAREIVLIEEVDKCPRAS